MLNSFSGYEQGSAAAVLFAIVPTWSESAGLLVGAGRCGAGGVGFAGGIDCSLSSMLTADQWAKTLPRWLL